MKFPTDLEKYARYFSEQNFTDKILDKAKVCEIFKLSDEVEISFPEGDGAMNMDEQ